MRRLPLALLPLLLPPLPPLLLPLLLPLLAELSLLLGEEGETIFVDGHGTWLHSQFTLCRTVF